MEKHKPYRCEVCGKRYKNLNGLKYHKNHSPACDTEAKPTQKQDPLPVADFSNQKMPQALNINFPVGGLPGESMIG